MNDKKDQMSNCHLKVFEIKKTKGPKQASQNLQMSHMPERETLRFYNIYVIERIIYVFGLIYKDTYPVWM
jgi:hypothetical protein